MALVRWRNDFGSLQREINELFNLDLYQGSPGLFDRNSSPTVDIIENGASFTVKCELPGVNLEDLDLSISSNVVSIKGEKIDTQKDNEMKYYRRESKYGSFQRTISLPKDVDNSKIDAILSDGVLTLTLPKKEEVKTKSIKVKVN